MVAATVVTIVVHVTSSLSSSLFSFPLEGRCSGGFRQEGAQALEAKAHAEVQSLEVPGLWHSGIQRMQDTQEGQDLGRV